MPSDVRLSAESADELFKALSVLARAVEHILETRAVETAIQEPLSSSKVQVLRLLSRGKGQTASQVARFLGVSNPAVSQIIDSLERSELVVRRPPVHDRREILLELTEQGLLKSQAVHREQQHLLRTAVRLSEVGDVDQWIATLRQIANAVARADQTFKDFCLRCGGHANGSCVLLGGDANCLFLQHHESSAKHSNRKIPKR